MVVSCKGTHCPKEIMLIGVYWYVAYPPHMLVGQWSPSYDLL